jgi:hypothetical protein
METADVERQLVPDLCLTASRYPADRSVRKLIADLSDLSDLSALSPRFLKLWESDLPARLREPPKHKTIDHAADGRTAVACDAPRVATDDLRVLAYTAEPGTEDADRWALPVVLGTEALVD